jgi:cytochrome P450
MGEEGPKTCPWSPAGIKPVAKPAVDIHVSATDARKRARGVQPGSFLSLMINSRHHDSGATFSDDEATSQAFTFLLAGYETTASALAFAIYTLAKHPDKTEKLVKVLLFGLLLRPLRQSATFVLQRSC